MDVRLVLLCTLFLRSVVAQDCVTVDFEEEFNTTFTNEVGACIGRYMWNLGHYDDLPIDSPDPQSLKYVYPNENLSCMSSFSFMMAATGVVEANIFMEPADPTDQVTILVNQVVPGGNDAVVGNRWIMAMDDDFVSGWRTERITLSGFGSYNGYISILGMAVSGSIVLVDSFRYIPPATNEDDCVIYERDVPSTITTRADIMTTQENTDHTDSPTDISTISPTTLPDNELTTQESETTIPSSPTTAETEDLTSTQTSPITSETEESTSALTSPITSETEGVTTVQTSPVTSETDDSTLPQTTPMPTEAETSLTTQGSPITSETEGPTSAQTTPVTGETEGTTSAQTNPITSETELTSSAQTTPITETEDTTSAQTTAVITESESTTGFLNPDPTTVPEIPNTSLTTLTETTVDSSDGTTSDLGSIPTEGPSINPEKPIFWNAYTITMVILLIILLIIIIATVSYLIGTRKRRRMSEKSIIRLEFEELPRPVMIPRVQKVTSEFKIPSL